MDNRVNMSSAFIKAAARLPKESRAKLPKTFDLLRENLRHPSLQMKKLEGAARDDIYECRLDQFWRIIVCMVGASRLDLVYVGRHDEALRLGASLRPDSFPQADRAATQLRVLRERGPLPGELGRDSRPKAPRPPSRTDKRAVRRFLMGIDDALDFEPVTEESLHRVLGSLD